METSLALVLAASLVACSDDASSSSSAPDGGSNVTPDGGTADPDGGTTRPDGAAHDITSVSGQAMFADALFYLVAKVP